MIDRRGMLVGAAALACGGSAGAARWTDGVALRATLAALERRSGGRLGVAVRDRATGDVFGYAADARFAMCSTFKVPLVAAILHRVDQGRERGDRAITVGRSDIVPHAPFCETRVGGRATVGELCEAAIVLSDNSAANLLLPIVGGPAGLTAFLRRTGDPATRLDRIEPALNSATPGDPRDTTTPAAMAASLDRLALGPVLTPVSRGMLTEWMAASRTGLGMLRAGVPQDWRVADKTGRGQTGTSAVIGVLWPPKRAPIVIASYLTQAKIEGAAADGVHRDVAQAVVAALRG
ncbi:class A beta-lactamase [Sphingomonas arantia]|uniref:Beta-lactamase n=1 Tax=Sphingomonas arantia TaxID=1460676 RepID=A0ABW4TW97_9SPHN